MFGQYAVSYGFDPDLARFLGRGFQYKKVADYEVAEYEPDVSAAAAMAIAVSFIDAVEAALKKD
jgi:hypothetical protein